MTAARRILYDLAGDDPALRFSPYCWRTRLALAHKGLEVDAVPWRFTEKAAIAFSGQDRVPVLVDGDRVVHDSFAIALYLEEAYPDRPTLFGGPGGGAVTRLVNAFVDTVVQPQIGRMIVSDIPALLTDADRTYFVASREARYGKPLAAVTADREATRETFRAALEPARLTLKAAPFLGGATPLYADHILFGSLQWARCMSTFELLAADDPVHAWRERMLDAYDGIGRKAVRLASPA